MFFNSIKENIIGEKKKGGKKSGGKKSGKYNRQKWTNNTDCKNREIEREPNCMIKDPNSGNFVACDPENDDHKGRIESHKKMLDRWKNGWCTGQEDIYKKKTEYDPKTVSWMKDNYSRWKNDMKKSLDEDIGIYHAEISDGNSQQPVRYMPAMRGFTMNLEFQ